MTKKTAMKIPKTPKKMGERREEIVIEKEKEITDLAVALRVILRVSGKIRITVQYRINNILEIGRLPA